MAARYLEDLRVGETWEGNAIPILEDAVIAFAESYDPQPMHVDRDAAAAGRFGGIIASGWHVAALVMRDYVETSPFGDTPLLGLQIDALRWEEAVRPGDVLRARREILEVTPSRSRPDRGLVRIGVAVTNQHGRTVMRYNSLLQIFSRSGGRPDATAE
ncbi:MaoC family dehydratase N-terminal domain-containing protein [Sphingomonas sp. PL-96]|uniref:MaoC/PaaZ C-terminal domain-containing protein n=1 Tax=Sphingomonas sp. PL-96 TaxID=2887201 RepID=UPI001E3D5DCC|nr:MaoC/PaaZ C-terminal domain-containing protein [Sphingomonas sp. PL-96]MCC2977887.1 MaoC family dehydratase N-terminal domain-containing protein [Sphingomonas sp. PL-96]